jgi:hypothetical protein
VIPPSGVVTRQPVIACSPTKKCAADSDWLPFPAVSLNSFLSLTSDYQIDQGGTKRGSSEMYPYLISTAHLWFVLTENYFTKYGIPSILVPHSGREAGI